MIAINYQPASIVDHDGFKHLSMDWRQEYFSDTVIPGRKIAKEDRHKLLQEGAEYISFTTDVWSSMTHCLDSQPIGWTTSSMKIYCAASPRAIRKTHQ